MADSADGNAQVADDAKLRTVVAFLYVTDPIQTDHPAMEAAQNQPFALAAAFRISGSETVWMSAGHGRGLFFLFRLQGAPLDQIRPPFSGFTPFAPDQAGAALR